MKRKFFSVALVGMVLCGLALPIWGRQTQHEMNQQAYADYKKADAKLNAAYKKLIAKLPKSRQAKLKKAQIAWLKFRDAESMFLASEMEGGSAEPMLHSGALANLTQKRTKELNDAYNNLMAR
jgi:uncharacterized protein YecT (DUF1311 family)